MKQEDFPMKKLLLCIMLSLAPVFATAQIDQPKEIQTSQKFGDYTVHYTVFSSKNIPAEVARVYQLTRAKDISYINISLTKTQDGKTTLGLPATITGTALNLMQQTKNIEFKQIKEPDATYYLAPFRHTNEEDFKFEIKVKAEGESKPMTVSFTRRLFTEN
jgi:hypothetical protein